MLLTGILLSRTTGITIVRLFYYVFISKGTAFQFDNRIETITA